MNNSVSLPATACPSSADQFEQNLRSCHDGMRRLAVRIVGDDADDVLQVAYIKAYRSLGSFRADAKFGTWMYRVVYNACVDHLRSVVRTVPLPDADVSSSEDVETAVIRRADLAAALGTLSVEYRAALMLVDAEGFSFADAAEVLDLPVGTVASRVSRARALLRVQMGDLA